MSTSESTLIPGNPPSWREFDLEDYDPKAEVGGDDDTLSELLAERTAEDRFGVVITVDPMAEIPDSLVKRLAAALVPTKIRRESRGEQKPGEKKTKKPKAKDKD